MASLRASHGSWYSGKDYRMEERVVKLSKDQWHQEGVQAPVCRPWDGDSGFVKTPHGALVKVVDPVRTEIAFNSCKAAQTKPD